MTMILGMPNLAGSVIACFLDNTVPGKIISNFHIIYLIEFKTGFTASTCICFSF